MFDSYPIVQIQGIYYKVDELKLLCKEKISNSQVQNWEKEIYLFLLELFSSSLTINLFLYNSNIKLFHKSSVLI